MSVSPERPLRVAVVADRPLVTATVRTALGGHGVETTERPWGARHQAYPAPDPVDVLLAICDLADPGLWLSPRLTGVVDAEVPGLVLTPTPHCSLWGAALASGAGAVLPDSTTTDELVAALDQLAFGGSPMAAQERALLLARWQGEGPSRDLLSRLRSLSPREAAVLQLLDAGHDVHSVADELGLGHGTVRTYVAAIRRKLGVRSQVAAVSTIAWLPAPRVPVDEPLAGRTG